MNQAVRYGLALLVAAVAVVGVAAAPTESRSFLHLAGIAVTLAVGTAYALEHPETFTVRGEPSLAAGAFGGASAFGTLALLNGPDSLHLGAGVLGFGLAWMGFATGVAYARE